MSIFQLQSKVAVLGISVLFLILSGNSVGQDRNRVCTTTEAQRAEAEAETLRSWDALYVSFRRYAQCDDGAIAEGYSESVARILVGHWSKLNRLALVSDKDHAFRRFVTRHIDPTVSASDLEKIRSLANRKCAEGLERLCDELGKRAESALHPSFIK
jgi:hypothetical protein